MRNRRAAMTEQEQEEHDAWICEHDQYAYRRFYHHSFERGISVRVFGLPSVWELYEREERTPPPGSPFLKPDEYIRPSHPLRTIMFYRRDYTYPPGFIGPKRNSDYHDQPYERMTELLGTHLEYPQLKRTR